jgi:excisionase family DNA binding protein
MSAIASFEPLLTFAQAAHFLGVSLRQVRRLVDCGKLPMVRVSTRAPRIRRCDLQSYLESVTIRYSKP